MPAPTFRWNPATGLATLAAAALCLIPALGALAAWHMTAEMGSVMRFAILPGLLLLGAVEAYLVRRHPLLFNRLAAGLAGGLVATVAMDLVRLPAIYAFHAMPDVVPQVGQLILGETLGIAPTTGAVALGYAFSYLLVGALLGAAYSLVLGKARWQRGLAAGLGLGLGFAFLYHFQLMVVAMGFSLLPAVIATVASAAVFGLVLGLVVERLGRTKANAFMVVFLRTEAVEALV